MSNTSTSVWGLIAGTLLFVTACTSSNENANLDNIVYEVNMEDDNEKLSYALGISIGKNLKNQGIENISKEAFLRALTDINSGAVKMTDQEASQCIQEEFTKIAEVKAEKDKAAGITYLEENAKKSGVVITESGLQYEILVEGNGPKPTTSDRVEVHYHGTLIDGTVFDSSVDRGEPTSFGVTQVISGWTEALQLMPTGSKWRLTIPQELGYGARGSRGAIPPYATLVFEVELLKIL